MAFNRVEFVPKDKRYPHLDEVADKIAIFLRKYRSMIFEYCEFMRLSSPWKKADYHSRLQQWKSRKLGRKKQNAAADTLELITLIEEFYNVCIDDYEIKKLRGLVPEKLLENIYKCRFQDIGPVKLAYGVKVLIDGKEIIYNPTRPYERGAEDSDIRKITIDVGTWDGKIAEFLEVKFSPEGFHTKDINYLRLLMSEMKTARLSCKTFLIAMGNKNLMRDRLKQLNLWQENEFELIGRDEVFLLEVAI